MEVSVEARTAFSGKLVTVEVHRVRLASGQQAVREVVRHPGAVVIVPVLGDGRVVLVRQFRFAAGEVLLELPAGTLHAGESPRECARRELAEETGYLGDLTPLGQFFSAPGFCDETLFCFFARCTARGPTQLDQDEAVEVVPLAPEAVALAVKTGQIRDAKTLAGLFLAQLHGLLQLPVGS